MKERPILFNSEMVRAILEGHKTQTRRVVKPQPNSIDARWNGHTYEWPIPGGQCHDIPKCPYGIPGDHLWVRETWGAISTTEDEAPPLKQCEIQYRADLPPGCTDYPGQWPADEARDNPDAPRWRPSIHMPRWASRITLEVLDMRVQRIQDISEEDALNEGIEKHYENVGWTYGWDGMPTPAWFGTARFAFRSLWDSINTKRGYSWDINPWVWAMTFRPLEAQ